MKVKDRRLATVVEFFGAPGVGKTYLAKGLVTYSKAVGNSFGSHALDVGAMPTLQRLYYKLRGIVQFAVLNPQVVADVFKFVSSSGIRGARSFVIVTINWLFILAVVKREIRQNDFVVLDQGLAQAYWSMVFRGAPVDEFKFRILLRRLLDACDVETLLVVSVNCERESHRVQLASRANGRSPLDDGEPIKFELGLQVTESVRNLLCGLERGASKTGVALLKYENGGSLNNEKLYEKLSIMIQKECRDNNRALLDLS